MKHKIFKNNKIKYTLYSVITLLGISGCAGITPEPEKEGKIYERDGVSTLLIPAETREVYFKDSRSFERHCRAPGPDVSIQSSSGISLGASIIGKSDEISETNGQSGLALGGRDPAVLLTRELMYRACELTSNLNANQKTTLYIYNRFLRTVEKSIKMQQLVGTASASNSAKSSLQNITLQNQKEPNTTVTNISKSISKDETETINKGIQSQNSSLNTNNNTNTDTSYSNNTDINSDTGSSTNTDTDSSTNTSNSSVPF